MLTFLRKRIRHWLDQSLFQLRDAEPGEVLLTQRRVFIVPSRPGLAFAFMLVLLFLCSINYNLSLGFGLTFLLAACAVIDMHLTFRNLAYLHLSAGKAAPVFAGEDALFELHLANRRKHARYAIWLGFIGRGMPALERAADVPGHGTSHLTLAVTTSRRGWQPAPRIRLRTRFPLGLLRAWSYWQPDSKALVYPQPEESLSTPPLPLAPVEKSDGSGVAGHQDFAGIRSYQSGDSPKHLAWRQIAKLDTELDAKLITKQFEGGAASDLSIDYEALPYGMPVESKLSRMTRWILEAEARQLPYAFRLGDQVYAAALGPAHQRACLRALALYEGQL
ncbi:DUF58 domain-containing protein [Collimonas pratensis]|uniref:Uncharacterized protein n=1 Tax=Collimonas pratensis TaxID=279113 RepID=A0A127QA02_9BURK|nr:DUF58 domain-containing protein [Collimonas pratensis]AMP06887.1 hypothetical protein CPter91_4581 [Collimonas pratensis]